LTWVLVVSAPSISSGAYEVVVTPIEAASGIRQLVDADTGEIVDATVYQRSSLRTDHKISGPSIVVETDTATLVTAKFDAMLDHFGNIVLNRKET
jgi:N-methylhydantoinase A/oxoprolinase/acetone carboxylase beta subunit